jgi:hypothetical protein
VKHKARFAGWLILAGLIGPLGFYRGWSLFDYVALGFLVVYAIFLAFSTFGSEPLLRRVAAMSPAEREKFMAQFGEEERQKLAVKLKDYLDRSKNT